MSVDFTGNAGSPIAPTGIPAGSSISRKINRGCRTSLEAADDTNNSSADFAVTDPPTPKGNAVTPNEKICGRCAGKIATITGTNGKNVLRGTPGADIIAGLGGKDTIRGRGARTSSAAAAAPTS